jgi:hypothetical protein
MLIRNFILAICLSPLFGVSQQDINILLVKVKNENRVDVFAGNFPFTSFLYPDSLEKPVLFPIYDGSNTIVTRGFPMDPRPGEPTDHPHHLGCWFTFENVNGLDFWNNSYAIPAEKKYAYGWIKTDKILKISGGNPGILSYHANWVNQKNEILMEETTRFEFSAREGQRTIVRTTELKADTNILLADAKDGLFGFRLAHELQIPSNTEQSFKDAKGNLTIVPKDSLINGNYLTSEGKQGDSAWSTRAAWCKAFGKIGKDSVSITIFDFRKNPNYPTFWHARGYGLFAANPLGEKIFTNGKSTLNLKIKKGESVQFRYQVIIQNGDHTLSVQDLNSLSKTFNANK